MDLIPRK